MMQVKDYLHDWVISCGAHVGKYIPYIWSIWDRVHFLINSSVASYMDDCKAVIGSMITPQSLPHSPA